MVAIARASDALDEFDPSEVLRYQRVETILEFEDGRMHTQAFSEGDTGGLKQCREFFGGRRRVLLEYAEFRHRRLVLGHPQAVEHSTHKVDRENAAEGQSQLGRLSGYPERPEQQREPQGVPPGHPIVGALFRGHSQILRVPPRVAETGLSGRKVAL